VDSKQLLKKEERGYLDHRFDTNNEVLVVKWKDSKVVKVASNFCGIHRLGSAKRYSQKDKKVINIPVPKLIQNYNNGMGVSTFLINKYHCTEYVLDPKSGGGLCSHK
jgi:hypothetical protein